jgi:hypothetical protein
MYIHGVLRAEACCVAHVFAVHVVSCMSSVVLLSAGSILRRISADIPVISRSHESSCAIFSVVARHNTAQCNTYFIVGL